MEKLIELYRQMAELTAPECRSVCRRPHSCCAPEHCESAASFAKEVWHVDLLKTDHPNLPYMGPNGCTVAPHLRPACTMHTCEVNSMGCKKGDPKWTERYFELREQIDELEFKRMELSP